MQQKKILLGFILLVLIAYSIFYFAKQKSVEENRPQNAVSTEIPQWFLNLYSVCKENFVESSCKQAFLDILRSEDELWGDVSRNFKNGNHSWKDKSLNIVLTQEKKVEGKFYINLTNEGPEPELEISLSYSLPEIILTVNHEIVHYANSEAFQKQIPLKDKLVDSCLSQYQISVLKDENKAFISEVRFWNQAPLWFKALFEGVEFHSKFTGIKQTYSQHYNYVSKKIADDSNYPARQYISMGAFPKCAKNFL